MASVLERFQAAVSVFREKDLSVPEQSYGQTVWTTSRNSVASFTNEGSIVTKIYNQISIDVSTASIRHVNLGQNGRYESDRDTDLARCLTLRPNIDQTAARFFQDLVWTMFDDGYCAVVPVDTSADIRTTSGFDVKSMRVGKIMNWYPRHIEIELYNDRTGNREKLTLPKENVAVINNPIYEVMNRPNSDLRRLIEKLRMLDAIDKQSASGQLDMIIQLPYEVRSDLKVEQAQRRRKDIERQLTDSQHGIAYIGATEKITQLNRPLTNNLMEQIKYLTGQVYSSLGLTEEVFSGTATEQVMLNYYNRTVNPILDEIVSAFSWAFLSQTARSQGQAIRWFRSPFALVPMSQFAEIATQFTSAEIATSNEIRSELGWKPADDPNADQLRNANINTVDNQPGLGSGEEADTSTTEDDRTLGEVQVSELT